MAGETLQDSLSGLQFSGADNSYGLGASALASSLPALINPRSSVGRNLAIGLGGTLLTALLGYQARQQASEDTIATMGYGNQILGASSPEEQFAIAKGVENTRQKAKLLTLVNALKTQGVVDARTLGMQRKLQEIQTQGNQAEAFGIPMAEVDAALQENMMARQQPTITGEGVPPLPPFPTQAQTVAHAQAIQNEQKRVSDLNQQALNNKNAAEAVKFAKGNELNNRSTAIASNPFTVNLVAAKSNLADLKNLIKSPTALSAKTMKQVFERTVNPNNMVTLQELGTYANAQSMYDRLRGQWELITSGEADISPQFKAELVEFAQMSVDARGTLYNTIVDTAVNRANAQGLEATFKTIAPMPRHITKSERTAALREINSALNLPNLTEGTKQELLAATKPYGEF